MSPSRLESYLVGLFALLIALGGPRLAVAAPATVNGAPFTLVATGPGTAQLFGLTSDAQGRIYIGNNSNNVTGIPVQRFDPALFSSSPVTLQDFGPAVGDADGITSGGGFVYVPDANEGVRRIDLSSQGSSVFVAGAAINGTGSPVVYRPSDNHLFVGFGSSVPGASGAARIDEYDAAGTFVQTFNTTAETETMTFDPAAGLIYYAPFGTEVRSFNPITRTDRHVSDASGFIDGGLAFDSKTGLIFVGTANGANSGLVETIDPAIGTRNSFASGFNGCLGILRDQATGNLYFLESNQLYRLDSALVAGVQLNISTRLRVLTGDKVLIGGVIIEGTQSKTVLFRALGPTLTAFNVPGALSDPTLELHATDGSGKDVILATNDNWRDSQEAAIIATGKPPPDNLESAIVMTLPPGDFTVIMRGKNDGIGVGLVEAYDVSFGTDSKLFNISSRGFVDTGDNVMIGGFIVGPAGAGDAKVLVRGLGPTLAAFNVPDVLADPTLELRNGQGDLIVTNDNWKTDDTSQQSQEAVINSTGRAPPNDFESAILRFLAPGNYTAILRGKNNTTGVALVEIYNVR